MKRLPVLAAVLVLGLALGAAALAAAAAMTLRLSADPSGALRYDKATLRAAPGLVTIRMRNPAILPHNVAIKGNGVNTVGWPRFSGAGEKKLASLTAMIVGSAFSLSYPNTAS